MLNYLAGFLQKLDQEKCINGYRRNLIKSGQKSHEKVKKGTARVREKHPVERTWAGLGSTMKRT